MYRKFLFFASLGGLALVAPLWAGCPSDKDDCDGCVIDGACVRAGAQDPEDPCLVCSPAASRGAYSPLDCSDGVSCNGEEACNPETGKCEPGEVTCPDDEFCDPDLDSCVVGCPYCSIDRSCFWENQRNPHNPCQVCRSTQEPYAWSANDGAFCDDGVFCNGADTCDGDSCSIHDGDPCTDDGLFCNGAESCDEATRSCVHSADPCGEGQTCDEEGRECCEAHDHLGCNAEGHVAWIDGCGNDGAVVEYCPAAPVGGCAAGQCICSAGWSGPACQQCVLFVSSTGDDAQDGRSWSQAKATVHAAITAAGLSGCPEIWVAEGVYPAAPSANPDEAVVLTPGLRLYGGFSGTETNLLERNLGAHATVFDGELGDPTEPRDNACRIVVMAAETRLDGFTVRNGSGSQGCTTWAYGLGIYAESINATVANCLLTGNGGHFGEAGILVSGSGRVLIHDTVFELNSSRDGALGASGSALVEVTDCIFRTNDSSFGSAITLREQAELAAVRCSFQDNDSPGGNATVASFDSSTATLTNCIFSGNNASVGAVQSAGASTTLVNCLVAGNVGTMSGGIWASGYGPTVLQNCTVANNTGNSTGGLLAMSNLVVVRNSILWGNTSNAATVSESQLLYSTGTLPMVRHTTMEGAPVLAGEGNRNADPLFVNADPGLGPLDLRLGAGSPCIDAGSTALLLPDEADLDGDQNVTEPIPFDLDGGARLAGAAVDMGAYEAP